MYYGFCNVFLRWFYITALSAVCGACIVVSLMDTFRCALARGGPVAATLRSISQGCLVCVCGYVHVSVLHVFSQPKYRTLRMSLYVGAGMMGGFPMAHMAAVTELEEISTVFYYLILMGVMYVGGALLYAARFPERFFPGRFDYLVSSWWCDCSVLVAANVCVRGSCRVIRFSIFWCSLRPLCTTKA